MPYRFALIFFLTSSCVATESAQDSTSVKRPTLGWYANGPGLSSHGISGLMSLNLHLAEHRAEVRVIGGLKYSSFLTFRTPSESILELAVLYGRPLTTEEFDVNVLVGIGYVVHITQGQYLGPVGYVGKQFEEVRKNTIGIPIEINGFVTRGRIFGLEAAVVGNFNLEQTFVGLVISLNIGKLK